MELGQGEAVRREQVAGTLDAAVRQALVLARDAARDENAAMMLGWWQDGDALQFMIVPEDHELVGRFAFAPIMLALPDGSFVSQMRPARELM